MLSKNIKLKLFFFSAREYNVIPDDVYLVHDELDKAVGKYNIKHGGSAR